MLEFISTLLVFAALIAFIIGICKACEQIATHMKGNPEAIKAIIEHVFVPLFGGNKESDGKSSPGTALVPRQPSEGFDEPPAITD